MQLTLSESGLGEIPSIIIAWMVLSFGITYRYFLGLQSGDLGNLAPIVAGFIATATGFILHEMGHRYVATQYGYVARFRLWAQGLLLTIIIVLVTMGTIVFGAPGAVYITPAATSFYDSNYRRADPERDNMIISAAGPGINLAFALLFLPLTLIFSHSSFAYAVGVFGFSLNVGLGSFNMLPVPPLDGSKIFRKSIPVALAIAIPLWALFLIVFLGF